MYFAEEAKDATVSYNIQQPLSEFSANENKNNFMCLLVKNCMLCGIPFVAHLKILNWNYEFFHFTFKYNETIYEVVEFSLHTNF